MPRIEIDLSYRIDSLSILDANGHVDKKLLPDLSEQQGSKLSLTVFVLQAVVAALKQFPRFNASLAPEAGALILKHYYHIHHHQPRPHRRDHVHTDYSLSGE